MKRIVVLGLVLAYVLSMAATALAEVRLVTDGEVKANMMIWNNKDLRANNDKGYDNDDFNVYERARLRFKFQVAEKAEFVMRIEYGTAEYGQNGVTSIGASAVALKVREAYVDFVVPDTDIHVWTGYTPVALPNNLGSFVLDSRIAIAQVMSPKIADMFNIAAGWGRAFSLDDSNSTSKDEFDVFYALAPFGLLDGQLNLTPFFVYGLAGRDAISAQAPGGAPNDVLQGLAGPSPTLGDNGYWWWAGIAGDVTLFDSFKAMVDFDYGSTEGCKKNNQRSGYAFDLAVDYTGWDFMTPRVFFAWTSGENSKTTDGSERLPTLDQEFAVGSTWFGGSSLLNGDMGANNSKLGFWTIGFTLQDISFLDKLSHDFTFLYAEGTNNENLIKNAGAGTLVGIQYGETLTKKDKLMEFDLNTKYQIYEELSAIAEIGYVQLQLDDNTWRNYGGMAGSGGRGSNNLWKLGFGFIYSW